MMSQIKKFEKQQNSKYLEKLNVRKRDTRLLCQNTSTKLDHPL